MYKSLNPILGEKPGNCGSILMLNLALGLSRRYHVFLIHIDKNTDIVAKELQSVLLPGNGLGENDKDRRCCYSNRQLFLLAGRSSPF